jgi:hypothetical protein
LSAKNFFADRQSPLSGKYSSPTALSLLAVGEGKLSANPFFADSPVVGKEALSAKFRWGQTVPPSFASPTALTSGCRQREQCFADSIYCCRQRQLFADSFVTAVGKDFALFWNFDFKLFRLSSYIVYKHMFQFGNFL